MKINSIRLIIIQVLIFCFPLSVFSESATIVLEGGKSVGHVNPLVWGTNLTSDTDSGEGVWDPKRNAANRAMVKATKKAGIKFLRFPGGCLTHNYLWKNGVGPVESRPKSESIYGNKHHNKFGIGEFINFCRQVNAEPIITVSYFAGGPKEAAELVEYCNGSTDTVYGALRKLHGYPEPFNIKYWEIGNEVMHGNSVPHQDLSLYAVTPITYALRYKSFSKLMKKIDPSILIGAVGMEMGLRELDSFGIFWNKNLIEMSQKDIDFISIHSYLPGYHTNPSSDPVGHFRALMTSASQTVAGIIELQSLWDKLSLASEKIPPFKVAITEYHAGFLSEERFSWGGALYLADFVMMLIGLQDIVIGSNYMEHSNGYWGMFRGFESVLERPDAKIFRSLFQNTGKKILSVRVSSSSFEPPDIGFIHSPKALISGMNALNGKNLVADAGFEKGAFSGPWHNKSIQGVTVKIDSTIKHSGNNSVKVDFDGTKDINFLHVYQYVDLVPGDLYRLSGYIRTENLRDVNGVSLALMDVNDYKLFNVNTQRLSGNNEWTWVEKIFKVPAKVTKAFLMLRRFADQSKISGTAWYDDVSIEKYKSNPIKKTPVLAALATESENGKELILWVINRSPAKSVDVNISFSNVELSSDRCKIQTFVGDASGVNALFAKELTISDSEKSIVQNAMTYKLAPASLTILSYDKK